MKKTIFQIGSFFMALCMLFVTLDLNVNFHWCNENHHLTSSFGDASKLCEHCQGHHHEHMNPHEFEEHLTVRHFDSKSCCEDFNETIGFTEGFTFSTEKPLTVFLPSMALTDTYHVIFKEDTAPIFRLFTRPKIPHLLTGRLKTIFFSSLKLNPSVF